MENHGMTVRFWGVRGSYPACGAETVRYGGSTACVEIEAGGRTLLLDAGTGIIAAGRSLVRRYREQRARNRAEARPFQALLLLSHLHHDHTQGFPFFAPAFLPGAELYIYGPDFFGASPAKAVGDMMQPPYFPIRAAELNANLHWGTARETDLLVLEGPQDAPRLAHAGCGGSDDPDTLRVRIMRSYAHPGGVLHFRVDWRGASVVYATDTEGYVNGDRRLANFARGADLLIHDAQYTDEHYLGLLPGMAVTQGFGHSTVSMACQAAAAAGARALALFHHAPEYSDSQLDAVAATASQLFPGALVAAEGLELTIPAREAVEAPAALLAPGQAHPRRGGQVRNE